MIPIAWLGINVVGSALAGWAGSHVETTQANIEHVNVPATPAPVQPVKTRNLVAGAVIVGIVAAVVTKGIRK